MSDTFFRVEHVSGIVETTDEEGRPIWLVLLVGGQTVRLKERPDFLLRREEPKDVSVAEWERRRLMLKQVMPDMPRRLYNAIMRLPGTVDMQRLMAIAAGAERVAGIGRNFRRSLQDALQIESEREDDPGKPGRAVGRLEAS